MALHANSRLTLLDRRISDSSEKLSNALSNVSSRLGPDDTFAEGNTAVGQLRTLGEVSLCGLNIYYELDLRISAIAFRTPFGCTHYK